MWPVLLKKLPYLLVDRHGLVAPELDELRREEGLAGLGMISEIQLDVERAGSGYITYSLPLGSWELDLIGGADYGRQRRLAVRSARLSDLA